MDQSTKTGKRIVSKGEYVAKKGKKAVLASFGAAIFLLGLVSAGIVCVSVIPIFRSLRWSDALPSFVGIGLLCGGPFALLYYGRKALKEGKAIDAGIPFTRANTADLPASDSLVRASQEPPQRQETVLLRAVLQGQDRPPEQMLRASIGPQSTEESCDRHDPLFRLQI